MSRKEEDEIGISTKLFVSAIFGLLVIFGLRLEMNVRSVLAPYLIDAVKRMSLKEAFLSPEFVLDLWIVVRIMNSPIALLVLWICLTAVFYLILRKR